MKLKPNELKVFYSEGYSEELDNAIRAALKPFGYELWASGMEIDGRVRDLAFEKKGEGDGV